MTDEMWSLDDLILPNQTALIVVDMQNDYCSKNGGFCKLGFKVDRVLDMAPRLAKFLKICRDNQIFVIHTRNRHSELTDTESWKRFGGSKLGLARAGSDGERWFSEFVPSSEDYVITKHRYDAFLNTDLETVLRAKHISTVLFTGTATNICVESTLRSAAMRDFNVVLVRDCTATYDPELQAATERNVEKHFGVVTTSEKIASAWAKPATPRVRID